MAKQEKSILENGVYLVDNSVFNDGNEHIYDVECFDGYAIATKAVDEESENAPSRLKLSYPLRAEIVNNEDKAHKVLEYRGLYDLKPQDITFGDIMMCMGKIIYAKR